MVEERVSEAEVKKVSDRVQAIKREAAKAVVGQDKIVDAVIRAQLAGGHILMEGVPGIAKTLIERTVASAMGCNFNRIQFTPDLLPSDIIGLTTYSKEKGFTIVKGPIFTNFLLADEINRASPKVQSALLEGMQEMQATIGRETFPIEAPFLVLATQNPIESLGTYPLPHAQVDRFMFKVEMSYPTMEEEQLVLKKNITLRKFEDYGIKKILSQKDVIDSQELTKRIYVSPEVERYIVRLVDATRNGHKYGLKNAKYIEYGASPRASIGLFIASKAQAVLGGMNYVTPKHVKEVAHDVMRHRIILSYEGQAEDVKTSDIISEVLAKVPV